MQEYEKDYETWDFDKLFDELIFSLENFIHIYRSWTPIGISPFSKDEIWHGAPPETKGAGYPGTQSILKAIEYVRKLTGLGAYDMHDRNVLPP